MSRRPGHFLATRTKMKSKRRNQPHLIRRNASSLLTSRKRHDASSLNPPGSGASQSSLKDEERQSQVGSKSDSSVSKDGEKDKGIRTRLSTGTLFMTGTSTSSSPLVAPESSTSTPETKTASSSKNSTPTGFKGILKRKLSVTDEDETSSSLPPKKKKIGRNNGSGEDNKNDYFCWLCHKEGKLICCELCPRVFHTKCLNSTQNIEQDWVCPECEKIMLAECTDTRSEAMANITVDMLCRLLRYALDRMKAVGTSTFEKPVDPLVFLNYSDYVFHPMCLSQLEKNIRRKMYGSTEAFLADAKWIVHNSFLFNGAQSEITSAAKSLLKVCKHEMNEIEVCPDCYLNSCVQRHEDWFCEPCPKPHPIVWAKLKGYPFWPAKILRDANGQVDVRFFGAHDRSWVSLSSCFMWSEECPNLVKKSRSGLDLALKEVKVHIRKLRERFGNFENAAHRLPYNKANVLKQLNPKLTGPTLLKSSTNESHTARNDPTSQPASGNGSSAPKGPFYRVSQAPGKSSVSSVVGRPPTDKLANIPIIKLPSGATTTTLASAKSEQGRQVIYLKPMTKGVFLLSQPSEQQLASLNAKKSFSSTVATPDLQLLKRIKTKINTTESQASSSSSSLPSSLSSSSSSTTTTTTSSSSSSLSSSSSSNPAAKVPSVSPSVSSSMGITSSPIILVQTDKGNVTSGTASETRTISVSVASAQPTLIPIALKTLSSASTTTPAASTASEERNINPFGIKEIPSGNEVENITVNFDANKKILDETRTKDSHQSSQDINAATVSSQKSCSQSLEQQSESSKIILRSVLTEENDKAFCGSGNESRAVQKNSLEPMLPANKKAKGDTESDPKEVDPKEVSKEVSKDMEIDSDSDSNSCLVIADTETTQTTRKSQKENVATSESPKTSSRIDEVEVSAVSSKTSLAVEVEGMTSSSKTSIATEVEPIVTSSKTSVERDVEPTESLSKTSLAVAIEPSTVSQSSDNVSPLYKSSLQKVIDSCKAKLGIEDEDAIALANEGQDDLLEDSENDDLHLYLEDDDSEEARSKEKTNDDDSDIVQSAEGTNADASKKKKSLENQMSESLEHGFVGELDGHGKEISSTSDHAPKEPTDLSTDINTQMTTTSSDLEESLPSRDGTKSSKNQQSLSADLKESQDPKSQHSKTKPNDQTTSHSEKSSQDASGTLTVLPEPPPSNFPENSHASSAMDISQSSKDQEHEIPTKENAQQGDQTPCLSKSKANEPNIEHSFFPMVSGVPDENSKEMSKMASSNKESLEPDSGTSDKGTLDLMVSQSQSNTSSPSSPIQHPPEKRKTAFNISDIDKVSKAISDVPQGDKGGKIALVEAERKTSEEDIDLDMEVDCGEEEKEDEEVHEWGDFEDGALDGNRNMVHGQSLESAASKLSETSASFSQPRYALTRAAPSAALSPSSQCSSNVVASSSSTPVTAPVTKATTAAALPSSRASLGDSRLALHVSVRSDSETPDVPVKSDKDSPDMMVTSDKDSPDLTVVSCSSSSSSKKTAGLWSGDSPSALSHSTVVHCSSSSSSPSFKDQDTVISLEDELENNGANPVIKEVEGAGDVVNDGDNEEDDDDGSDIIMEENNLCIDFGTAEEGNEGSDAAPSAIGSQVLSENSLQSSNNTSQAVLVKNPDEESQLEKTLELLFQVKASKITSWLDDQLKELKANAVDIVSRQENVERGVTMDSTGSNDKKKHKVLLNKLADWKTCHSRTIIELRDTYKQERFSAVAMCKWNMERSKQEELTKLKRKLEEEHASKLASAVAETKKRQWCADCWKEAVYYCCWNTSYCSYQCQQKHWPSHLPNCMQAQQSSESTPSAMTSTSSISFNGKNISIIKPPITTTSTNRIVKTLQAKMSVVPGTNWQTAKNEGNKTMSGLPMNQASSSSMGPKTSISAIHSGANVVGNSLQIFPNVSGLQASTNTNLTFSPAPIQPVQIQYLQQPSANQQQVQLMGGANPNIPVIVPSIMAGNQNIPANVQLLQNASVFPMVQQQQPASPASGQQPPISGGFVLSNSFGGMLRQTRPM